MSSVNQDLKKHPEEQVVPVSPESVTTEQQVSTKDEAESREKSTLALTLVVADLCKVVQPAVHSTSVGSVLVSDTVALVPREEKEMLKPELETAAVTATVTPVQPVLPAAPPNGGSQMEE